MLIYEILCKIATLQKYLPWTYNPTPTIEIMWPQNNKKEIIALKNPLILYHTIVVTIMSSPRLTRNYTNLKTYTKVHVL